jgi:hypothetical protein
MTDGPFTMARYRHFLARALELSFEFRTFDQPPGPGATVHLRHDVDNSPVAAVPMAEAEAAAGVRSTYLFMVRHENYNLLAAQPAAAVRRVAALGHAVGLHVVLSADEVARAGGVAQAVAADAEVVAQVAGRPVGVFSFHNPQVLGRHPALVGQPDVAVEGLVNAYGPPFFGPIRYLSESNMRWREGPPEEVLARGGPVPYQILVHPYSYVDDLRDDRQLLLHFVAERVGELLAVGQADQATLGSDPIDRAEVGRYLQERFG